jgi:ATP-dependent RNA helicase RhlE
MNKKFSRRPSGRGASRGGFSRGRPFNGRGGNGGGRRRGPADERIDASRFINKVVAPAETERFTPEHTFQDFDIHPRLKAEIAKKGYEFPTPIQDKVIPHVLNGEDVVGIANTGTGKTAAFLIPLIHKVVSDRNQKILIVVPTRELAIQIEQEFRSLTAGSGIYSVVCVGGANVGPQIARLRSSPHFVIGTPGRLKDLIERKKIYLSDFETIVLDEADRMLDMGFLHDMRAIVAGMPQERQGLFLSATISPPIEKLIGEFLKTPARVSVKTRDTSQNVDQDVVRVGRGNSKFDVLHELLVQEEFSKVLIFGRTKHGVEKLSKVLIEKGIRAESIHGNKNHSKRQRALGAFKESRVQVLVATDVAARGLDIPDVSHVINFDLPSTYADYVHRIGRTGRGEKQGKALTFIE